MMKTNLTETLTRSRAQIVKDNVFTLFNFLNFAIAAMLFAVGAYSNMLFIAVILANIAIGIMQECEAKKLVDELSILNQPTVRVRRDGQEQSIPMEELVPDDLMLCESGDQILSDAVIVEGMLEVNESLLTGESDAVVKERGAELLSGSSVIAGRACARVTHVGEDNYATRLANEVKKEKQVASELLGSMRKVTRFTSLLIVPLGIVLFLEALLLRNDALQQSVVASSAALLGMLPKGLVLLISVSLATGVIRLARQKILVQNLYSLETLAHVDVLCLDKTGTITDGRLKVDAVMPLGNLPSARSEALVQSYLSASEDNNATFSALQTAFSQKAVYEPTNKIPFSSKRKWGCVSFAGAGTVFAGAPEKLLGTLPAPIEQELEQGKRVLVIAYCEQEWTNPQALPKELLSLYCVVFKDTIRPNARRTLRFFREQGVDVKMISGDHVKTVSQIAKRAGLHNWQRAVDLSKQPEPCDYCALCEQYSVFARVTPKQKKALVQALRQQGHTVAMTGDGVNDLLALREADCSIAVADGSAASRQLAQIVLLDSDFGNLPQVVMEGRKVVNNVTRTASVFFIKTIYSVLVSVLCLFANLPFPFIPIQITLVDAGIEAWPSFLTILEADTRKIRGSFLKTALSHALPYALTVTGMIAMISLTQPFTQAQRQTVMYLLLIIISMAAVCKSCIPLNRLRAFILATMVLGIAGALLVLPGLLALAPVTAGMAVYLIGGATAAIAVLFVLEYLQWLTVNPQAHAG